MNPDQSYRDRFQLALVALWQIHKPDGPPLPIETQRAYLMALGDIPIDNIEAAAIQAAKKLRWFPKPAELRELAFPKPNIELEGIEAWALVRKHVVQYRVRKGPMDFGPIINAAIRAVGGIDFLATEPADSLENFTRKRFLDAYRLYRSQQTVDEQLGRPLIGEGADGKPVQRIGLCATSNMPTIEHHPDPNLFGLANRFKI